MDGGQNINIPGNKAAFGRDGHAAVVSVDQLQGVAGEPHFPFKGVVGVAHRPGGDEGGPGLPGQVVPEDAQGVRLGPHRVKPLDAVAVAAAVAVQAAVAAPPVDIHGVVSAEPLGVPVAVEQMLCRYGLHSPLPLLPGGANPSRRLSGGALFSVC